MKKATLGLALAALLPATALAEVSSTFTLTSDYVFDGVSQTREKPAIQASVDYAHDSGFYAGVWGSNVDFGAGDPAEYEVDYYGGFVGSLTNRINIDTGVIYYSYSDAPKDGYDCWEAYFGVTVDEDWGVTAWYADDDDLFGGRNLRIKALKPFQLTHDYGLELELTAVEKLQVGQGDEEYLHWRVGVNKTFGDIFVDLSYHDTDIDDEIGEDLADARLVLSVSHTYDWF